MLMDYLGLFYAGPQQALPVVVAIVLWVALAGIGYLVAPRAPSPEARPFIGWAAISTVFTLVGTVVAQPFFVLSIMAGIAALAGVALATRRREPLFLPGTWRVAVLASPLLLIAGAMAPSQWDEFSHWLPAARFMTETDGFATAERSFGGFPGYPPGWPLLLYLSARVAGRFLDNMGGQFNVLMLLMFAGFALRSAFEVAGRPCGDRISWPFAAAIGLTATAFNPVFVQKIVLTAYSDVSSAVATGVAILFAYQLVERLRRGDAADGRAVAWQFALALALLINIRQTNVVVAGALLSGLALVAWRDADLSSARLLRTMPLIVAPALAVYLAWRIYIVVRLAGIAEVEADLQPLPQWGFALIPEILMSMAEVWIKKFAFFAPMLIACALAARALVRKPDGFDRIALLTAIVFAINTAFLFVMYLGHFSGAAAASAVSYWRYNIDIGMVAMIFLTSGAVWLWSGMASFDRYPPWLAPASIVASLALPLAFAPKLRFDLEPPKPHFTRVANDLADAGIEANVRVVDPTGTGEAAVITRYYLDRPGSAWLSAFQGPNPELVRAYLGQVGVGEYVLVHSTTQGLSEALHHEIDARRSYLFKRDGGWTFIREWAKPANHPW